jgi:hypothetical protein
LVGGCLVLVFNKASGTLEVGRNHLVDELVKVHFTLPAKKTLGFSRVTEEEAVKTLQCQSAHRAV